MTTAQQTLHNVLTLPERQERRACRQQDARQAPAPNPYRGGGMGRSVLPSNYPSEVRSLGEIVLTGEPDAIFRAKVRKGLVAARLSQRIDLGDWEAIALANARAVARKERSEARRLLRRSSARLFCAK
jgi:hypothetical protein